MNSPAAAERMYAVETGQGSPVILVHGAFSDYRVWEPQRVALAGAHSLISLSLRGYYPTQTRIEGASAERHVEDLVDLIQRLAEPAVLIGHSRGGRIALEAAARCGARVGKLVLVEPGGVMEPDFLGPADVSESPSGPDMRMEAQRLIAAGRARAGLEAYIDFGHGAGTWGRLPTWFQEMAIDNAHTIAMMIADKSVPLSRRRAQAIVARTLMIVGAKSPGIFHETVEVLKASIVDNAVSIISEGNHFMSLLKSTEFNHTLAKFLDHGS